MQNKKWPEDFIARVKVEYPDNGSSLYDWLDTDSTGVDRFIDGNADGNNHFAIKAEEIVEAFQSPDLAKFAELRKKAEKLVYRANLYRECITLYDIWFNRQQVADMCKQ